MRKRQNLPELPNWLSRPGLHRAVLFVFSFLLYLNTLTHDYALDDAIVLTDNLFVQQGLQGLEGLFSKDTFYGFFKEEGKDRLVAGGRYRPLSLATFALEVALFGQNPGLSHLINVLLYGLLVVLLYELVRTLASRRKHIRHPALLALAAAALFAAHPLHTEVVANIKGRDEILALLGSATALWLAFRLRGIAGALLVGLVFFAALLSKENAISFLALAPLAFWLFGGDRLPRVLLRSLPFLVATGLFLAIRFSVLGPGLGEPSMELMNNPFLKLEDGRYLPYSGPEKAATILYTLGLDLKLLFWPHPLTHDYYPQHIARQSLANPWVWLSGLFYAALLTLGLWGLRKRRVWSYGIWLYLLPLALVANIFFPVGTFMSERFLFMPSLGLAFLFGLGIHAWVKRRGSWRVAIALAGGVVAAFGLLSLLRNPVWKDNFTLFTTDIATSGESAKLNNAVGGALIARSVELNDDARKKAMLERADMHLEKAIRLHPNYKNAYLLRGNALNYLKQYDASIAHFQQALTLDPEYEEARNNLGITYREAGKFFGEQKGDLAKATQYLEAAYRMRPEEYETVRLLGVAYGIQQRHQEAIRLFGQAARLEPENAEAWLNLAKAHFNAGNLAEGQAYRQKALALDPGVEQKPGG